MVVNLPQEGKREAPSIRSRHERPDWFCISEKVWNRRTQKTQEWNTSVLEVFRGQKIYLVANQKD
jgi:hypothetical protein